MRHDVLSSEVTLGVKQANIDFVGVMLKISFLSPDVYVMRVYIDPDIYFHNMRLLLMSGTFAG